jgi:hypothetical protein
MDFEESIKEDFGFLFKEYGFKVLTNDHNDETRDFVIIAYGYGMKFRFIQDRADFFMDVSFAAPSEEWISFYKVLDSLRSNGVISNEYKVSNKRDVIKSYLRKYFKVIEENKNIFK